MTRQLELPLGFDEPTDFFVTECNYLAHEILFAVNETPLKRFFLRGEAGSGKTTLGRKWVAKIGTYFDCHTTIDISITQNVRRLVLDHIELVEELELMGIVNRCMNHHIELLMISRKDINFKLPDLASRVYSSHLLKIESPDKQLVFFIVQDFCFNHGLKIHYKALAKLEDFDFPDFISVKSFARNLKNITYQKRKKTINSSIMQAAYDLRSRN
jgi:chromosomal replication initiation ATPase DnaA